METQIKEEITELGDKIKRFLRGQQCFKDS